MTRATVGMIALVLAAALIAGCAEQNNPPGGYIDDPSFGGSCDASKPCKEGYDCVKLPEMPTPLCVTPEVLQRPEYKGCMQLESYPVQLKCPGNTETLDPYSCKEDADCVIKDVHNCCGYYPRCVSKDYTPDIEAVKQRCAEQGMASVCGYPEITGCECSDGKCVSLE